MKIAQEISKLKAKARVSSMEHITVGQIVGAITSITVIIGFIATVYNFVKKTTLDKIEQNSKEIEELKLEVGLLKREAKESKNERLILLKGQLACLKGLKEQGCNGPVTQAIGDIENYLMEKSHN